MRDIQALKAWTTDYEKLAAAADDLQTLVEFHEEGEVTAEEVDAEMAKTNKLLEALEVKKMLSC